MTANVLGPTGRAKVLKTQRRVLEALTTLTVAEPAVKLTLTAVCRKAGVSPDALALGHHAELKAHVERGIAEHNATHFGETRRKARPSSDVALARIDRLQRDLADLRSRYDSAVQSVFVLASALEEALGEVERLRQQTPVLGSVVALDRVIRP